MSRIVLIVLTASAMIVSLANATEDYQNVALQVHNKYRAVHQADDLSMDGQLNDLATKCAQYYLNIGKINHKCPYKEKAGENLYWSSVGLPDNSKIAEDATTSWYDEYKKYNFNNPGFSDGTGHFTQVVWKESKKLGFGVASGNSGTYVVALYSPRGNFGFRDDYARNVKSASSMMASISSYKYFIIYSATIAIYYAL